jgi:RNA polymerase sigma factor (sigma-70 family)
MDQKTDAELIAKVRLGDKDAFRLLVERYQQMVGHIAKKMVADEWVAHELAQEAILQAYLSLNHLRDASRFKSWLYGITLNICRSYLHDQKMDMLSLETIMGGVRSDIIINFDNTVDPQTIAEAHELHRLVLSAIDELSSKDKEATLLFYYEQLTLQEIAALSGVSVGAIKGRLHRARKQLQIERIELHTEFRELNREVVLNEHKEQKEDFLQFFASLNRSILELELQRDKEEREKTKQESIASWKEEYRQNQ